MIRAAALVSILAVSALAHPQPTNQAVKETVGKLDSAEHELHKHSGDAEKIERAIAEKQSRLRVAKHKHHVLTEHEEQLEKTHTHLVKTMKSDHDARLKVARGHLKKEKSEYENKVDAKQHWEEEAREAKEEEARMVKEADAAHHLLAELRSKVVLQTQQEEMAERKFQYSNQMAKEEAQSLKYAEAQYQSELARLKKAQDAEKMVEKKVGEQAANIRAIAEVEDAKRDVVAEQDDANNWKADLDKIREKAAEMSSEEATSYQSFVESQSQLRQTKEQTKLAENDFKMKQEQAAKEYEILQKAEGQLAAESAKLTVATAGKKAAEQSVQKLDAIRINEEKKIQANHEHGKKHLEQKLKAMDATRDHAANDIANLKKQYGDWQESQQHRQQKVADVKKQMRTVSKEYAERLRV